MLYCSVAAVDWFVILCQEVTSWETGILLWLIYSKPLLNISTFSITAAPIFMGAKKRQMLCGGREAQLHEKKMNFLKGDRYGGNI